MGKTQPFALGSGGQRVPENPRLGAAPQGSRLEQDQDQDEHLLRLDLLILPSGEKLLSL